MKALLRTERGTESVKELIWMDLNTQENITKTNLMAMVSIFGKMENSTKESGKKANFTEKGSKHFQTERYSKETGKKADL